MHKINPHSPCAHLQVRSLLSLLSQAALEILPWEPQHPGFWATLTHLYVLETAISGQSLLTNIMSQDLGHLLQTISTGFYTLPVNTNGIPHYQCSEFFSDTLLSLSSNFTSLCSSASRTALCSSAFLVCFFFFFFPLAARVSWFRAFAASGRNSR